MAKARSKVSISLAAVLAASALAGYVWTDESPIVAIRRAAPSSENGLVDDRPVKRTRALQAMVATAEEQQVALDAGRVADHEVDQAFASALREVHQRSVVLSAEAATISARAQTLEKTFQTDTDRVNRLQAGLSNAPSNEQSALQQALDLAKAQLALDGDELSDTKDELARATGNPAEKIQQELAAYESASKESDALAKENKPSAYHVAGFTLAAHLGDWWRLRAKEMKLDEALLETRGSTEDLSLGAEQMRSATAAARDADARTFIPPTIERLRSLAEKNRVISIYEDRIVSLRHLGEIYEKWKTVVRGQMRVVWHAALGSLLLMMVIVLFAAGGVGLVDRIYREGEETDRRLLTTRVAYRSAIQALGLVLVLLVIFGVPNQVATVLALAGAGLTVAFKDYIVGFFGWFTLMGRRGIRVGDWVEIDGVAGEVLEISPLHTVLLETGSWSDAGHPTGRKVSFVNSFAIEGHYFNFTTGDRWLWDELEIPIPREEEPCAVADSIRKMVSDETAEWTTIAEQEWQTSPGAVAGKAASLGPMVNLRPTAGGVNVIVRYVTQVSNRNEVRSRLYQTVVSFLYSKDRNKDSPQVGELIETAAIAEG